MDTNDISRLRKIVGLREVTKYLALDKLQTIVLATDADLDYEKKVLGLASVKNVPVLRAETKVRLAELCGIDKIATVVGILKQQD